MLDRAALGAITAAVVAFAGYKTRSLTQSGAAASIAIGTLCVAAGWSWGILLVGLFITATVLSKIGEAAKAKLLEPVIEKGGERDAWQVAANGSVYALSAAGAILSGDPRWFALGIGALAASTADTWSTEIGTMGGGTPRLIVSGKRVPAGTSGGLTIAGSIGALAGAVAAAAAAAAFHWPVPLAAATLGGVAGAFGDSLLGAVVQSRRWCSRCGTATERKIHTCGTPTGRAGGLSWLDNDGVNFASTIIGGLVTLLLSVAAG